MASNGLEVSSRADDNAFASVKRMHPVQQAGLAGAFIVVVGLMYFVSQLGSSPTMTIIYSDLEPTAAAEIVNELSSRGIEYELTDNGRVIWVPQNMVSQTRLDLSAAGLPNTSSGWSVLDDQGITSSDFDQRVGYQRAMEGELANTIAAIDGVTSAKVHLVIPEQDLFVDDEIMASASVLLQMDGSTSLSPGQVEAVVNLVASSVEGLEPSEVTVTDGSGMLLAGGDDDATSALATDNQLRMGETFESELQRQLTDLLTAVVGPGRSVVTVAADLDFDSVRTTQEEYLEPLGADGLTLPRAETTRNEQYGNGADDEEGVVDIETEILEGPAEGAADGRTSYQLSERDVSYALNSIVTTTEKAPGTIRSLSVAVVIDEAVVDAARLPEIEAMVTAAVGTDAERGDVVAVSLLPFDISLEEQEAALTEAEVAAEEAAAIEPASNLLPMIRTVGATLIALVVLILGLRMLRKASRRKVIDSIDVAELTAGLTDDGASTDGDGTESIEVVIDEEQEQDLFELISNQPDDMAAVLRQWLAQPEHSG